MNPAGQLWGEYADAGRSFSRAARLCLVAGFLVWLGRGIQGVLFNLYLVAGGFEEAFVGQALGAAGLGLATAATPAGLLADRLGRRRCLMLGVLVEATGALGRACLLDGPAILAASFVLGSTLVYLLSKAWAFPSSANRGRRLEYLVFLLLAATGLLLNSILMWALVSGLGLWYMAAKVISAAIVSLK